MTQKRSFAMPDVFVILFILAALLAALSHIIPAGVFDVQQVNGKARRKRPANPS
jgi:uncharacterized ion transporter superfamily protein YfcC